MTPRSSFPGRATALGLLLLLLAAAPGPGSTLQHRTCVMRTLGRGRLRSSQADPNEDSYAPGTDPAADWVRRMRTSKQAAGYGAPVQNVCECRVVLLTTFRPGG